MPITSVTSDSKALTLKVVADYPVPVARLWAAYADPRQLERFWGPVEWPATFTRHDMAVGGRSQYYMTGPDGTTSNGWFRFLAITPLARIELEDGFSDEHDQPNAAMPTMRMVFTFAETPTGSRFESVTTFATIEAMESLVQMGMVEGMRSAMGQLDAVLQDLAAFSATRGTKAQLLSDTTVRISRVIRGTVEQVWRAHHDPALVQRWLLGPDGWTMPVCQVATTVGEHYRYEWEAADGSKRFGLEGEMFESEPPYRAVFSEQMVCMEGPGTRNEMTLVAMPEGTLLSLVITYPNKAMRDMILGSGMTDGMETSYARLEQGVLAS